MARTFDPQDKKSAAAAAALEPSSTAQHPADVCLAAPPRHARCRQVSCLSNAYHHGTAGCQGDGTLAAIYIDEVGGEYLCHISVTLLNAAGSLQLSTRETINISVDNGALWQFCISRRCLNAENFIRAEMAAKLHLKVDAGTEHELFWATDVGAPNRKIQRSFFTVVDNAALNTDIAFGTEWLRANHSVETNTYHPDIAQAAQSLADDNIQLPSSERGGTKANSQCQTGHFSGVRVHKLIAEFEKRAQRNSH